MKTKAKAKIEVPTGLQLEPLINALACALAVLEGTAGGYTPQEKMNAKMTLNNLQRQLMLKASA